MRRLAYFLFFFVTLCPAITLECKEEKRFSSPGNPPVSVDSVLSKVIQFAPLYETLVNEYRADVYMKGRLYIRKKNFLLRFAPSMFKQKKGVREYLTEAYSEFHYTAPNIYDQKIKATYGTIEKFKGIGISVVDYFQVNIYSTSLLNSKLLSPLSPIAPKYYKFQIDSLHYGSNDNPETLYRISFTPKNKSYQLVKGYMLISDNVWSVREFQFSGRSEYFQFENCVKMGEVGSDNEFLPERYDLNATFHLFGNKIDGNFTGIFDYTSIQFADKKPANKKKKRDLDLTESFTLQHDTTNIKMDSAQFAALRPIPLTSYEENFYKQHTSLIDTTKKITLQDPTQLFWRDVRELGDALISNHTLDMENGGNIKFSPIINPFLISYSGRDGLSYRYNIRYNRNFEGDRLLRISPRLGYNFKYSEFYWRVHSDFDYWPRKHASLHLNVGNGNRIYSSDVLEELKGKPDSIMDFSKFKLDYFRDLYFDLRHRVEIVNGLIFDVGISAHKRTPVKNDNYTQPIESLPPPEDIDPNDAIKDVYISFAPRLRLEWTPYQYYYMNGDRKINLNSKWPTFSLDWERGVKGIFKSNGEYERLEFDMQHQIPLGLMRTLYYRVGCGAFTDQSQLYFVDFVNFAKNNLPSGWNDDIGGVFQELDRRWYNASHKYTRANITYEAPFLLIPHLLKHTPNVINERLYLGVLCMPNLNPYIELGYGIGTHIFDLGVFASSENGKYTGVGFKFTLELFNR